MSRFLAQKYASLTAYVPGEQPRDGRYIKLNTNESPYPPAPGVCDCLRRADMERLRLYPDPQCLALRAAVAGALGLQKENVMAVNGSDDALNFAFMAFGACGAIFPDITYGFNAVFAALHGVDCLRPPLREDFTVRVEDYLHVGRTVILANPNAPTGVALPLAQIERILQSNPDNVVVVDEAYVDFGAQSAVGLIPRYENLLVIQTCSKSRSLAGARLGFALGNEKLIADLELLRCSTNPYNIDRLTLAIGEAAFADAPYYAECAARIRRTRERTAEALAALGFTLTPSCANFLFARHPAVPGGTLYQKLKARGILVRHFDTARLAQYNRITVGTVADMDALIANITEILQEEQTHAHE